MRWASAAETRRLRRTVGTLAIVSGSEIRSAGPRQVREGVATFLSRVPRSFST
jgi:hypothetical protein